MAAALVLVQLDRAAAFMSGSSMAAAVKMDVTVSDAVLGLRGGAKVSVRRRKKKKLGT